MPKSSIPHPDTSFTQQTSKRLSVAVFWFALVGEQFTPGQRSLKLYRPWGSMDNYNTDNPYTPASLYLNSCIPNNRDIHGSLRWVPGSTLQSYDAFLIVWAFNIIKITLVSHDTLWRFHPFHLRYGLTGDYKVCHIGMLCDCLNALLKTSDTPHQLTA